MACNKKDGFGRLFVFEAVLAHTDSLVSYPLSFRMKFGFSLLFLFVASATPVLAQDRIYRCGNEYTNTVTEAQAKSCKLVSGGNVTVVPGARAPNRPSTANSPGQSQPRTDAAEQRAKDSDAKLILESELKRAEARQVELIKEYNGGVPEKLGPETRNNQKYLDRIAELKANMTRNDSDIAGIRREMGRLPAQTSSVTGR